MAIQGASKTSCRAAYEKFGDGSTKDISNELPFALPNGWVWTRLGRLTTLVTSGSRNWAQFYTTSQQAPLFLRMGNLSRDSFSLRLGDLQHVELPKDAEGTRTSVLPGDLLFSITAEIGMMGLIPESFPLAYINQHTALIRFSLIQQGRYLPYTLLSTFAKHQYASRKHGLKTSFRLDSIEEVIVPLPPISEQKRIVTKIEDLFTIADSMGDAVDGLGSAAKRLDKKILDLAIRGKLVPQDSNDEPASELVKRIAASHRSPCKNQSELIHPPFAIPQSWEWVRLGAICEILDSMRKPVAKSKRKPGPYPYYGATCIQDFVSDFIFDEPLVLLGEDGAKWGKGDKSAFCVDGKIWVNNHAHVLRPCDGINHIYLVCTLDILDLMPYVTGTTVPKLNQEKMCDIQIPLPPLAEQKRIVAKIEELRAVIKSLTT